MKIVVIGAGAVGGFLGALLTKLGEDVTLVKRNEESVRLIQKEGLLIKYLNGEEIRVRVNITTPSEMPAEADFIMICVKSYDTRDAANVSKALLKKDSFVLSIQNGEGNLETIASVLGSSERIGGGVFYPSIMRLGENKFQYIKGTKDLTIGTYDGTENAQLQKVARMFREARIEVTITNRIQDAIWNKLVINIVNAIGALTGIPSTEFLDYPSLSELIDLAASEAVRVGKLKGINFDDEEKPLGPLFNLLDKFKKSGNIVKSSMLQDLNRGRKTEIDFINGAVVKAAEKYGLDCTVNKAIVLIVKALEQKVLSQ